MEDQPTQPTIPAFNQKATWDPQAEFTIKGYQLQALVNLTNIFRNPILVIDQIIQQGIMDGKAQTEFFDENNQPVPKEVVDQVYAAFRQQTAPIPQPSSN